MNHLGNIYPEVRLKKYLEMRGVDCGPKPFLNSLFFGYVVITLLLSSPVACVLTQNLLHPNNYTPTLSVVAASAVVRGWRVGIRSRGDQDTAESVRRAKQCEVAGYRAGPAIKDTKHNSVAMSWDLSRWHGW